MNFHGVRLDGDTHNDEDAFIGLSPGARWVALCHRRASTSAAVGRLDYLSKDAAALFAGGKAAMLDDAVRCK